LIDCGVYKFCKVENKSGASRAAFYSTKLFRGRMKRFKWRILLSLSNVLLAIGLSVLGVREYETFSGSREGAFYHGHHVYLPAAQLISYCMNAPAFLLENLLGRFQLWSSVWGNGWWFYYVSHDFYFLVFLFWWCIGWHFDIKRSLTSQKTVIKISGYILAASFLGFLLFTGARIFWTTQFPNEWYVGGRTIAFSMLLWGVGLLAYLVASLLRQRRVFS
jgi:hypothetical protein